MRHIISILLENEAGALSRVEEVKRLVDIFRGRIIDVTDSTYTLELTGTVEKLDAFVKSLDVTEIIEVARSGVTGIARGDRALKV